MNYRVEFVKKIACYDFLELNLFCIPKTGNTSLKYALYLLNDEFPVGS